MISWSAGPCSRHITMKNFLTRPTVMVCATCSDLSPFPLYAESSIPSANDFSKTIHAVFSMWILCCAQVGGWTRVWRRVGTTAPSLGYPYGRSFGAAGGAPGPIFILHFCTIFSLWCLTNSTTKAIIDLLVTARCVILSKKGYDKVSFWIFLTRSVSKRLCWTMQNKASSSRGSIALFSTSFAIL